MQSTPQNPYVNQQYTQPQQPQSYTQEQKQSPVANNSATFIADANVLSIIHTVHPELASAMINIAIKKFAIHPDFNNYFVKDEFKEHIEPEIVPPLQTEQASPQVQIEQPSSAPINNGADFTTW